jgi:hypothetical protein
MQTDLDLFKAIVRATQNVPMDRVSAAVAQVRALFVTAPTEQAVRADRGNRNRMERGGQDRSE